MVTDEFKCYTYSNDKVNVTSNAAIEITVDAYASRIIKECSAPEVCIDSSVGSYVTSILRCANVDSTKTNVTINVQSLTEYDSLVELLQEHCNINDEVAHSALQNISNAVQTGNIGSSIKRFRSKSLGFEENGAVNSTHTLDNMLRYNSVGITKGTSKFEDEFPFFILERSSFPNFPHGDSPTVSESCSTSEDHNDSELKLSEELSFTPSKLDSLLPVDLLGAISNPSISSRDLKYPLAHSDNETFENIKLNIQTSKPKEIFQDAAYSCKYNKGKCEGSTKNEPINLGKGGGRKGKKKSKGKPTDLAAILFCSPRPRSNSCSVDYSSRVKPLSTPQVNCIRTCGISQSPSASIESTGPVFLQEQVASMVQILLSANFDLCEEAAYDASQQVLNSTNCTLQEFKVNTFNLVNMAQYLIDGALNAPPICRHMLSDGCYRSDCHFSHDVDGHTCLFWIKGRCDKGRNSCRFLHGFSKNLLDGINGDSLSSHQNIMQSHDILSKQGSPECLVSVLDTCSNAIPIKTTNLVIHNRSFKTYNQG